MTRGNGKTSAAIKCHFVYSITYRQPCFVPVANGFEKKRLQAIRDGAWWRRSCGIPAFMPCIRLVCFRIESVRPGTELFVSSDRFASRVLIIRKWPDQSPFFTLSALLGRGCTVGLKGMHRWFERNAPLLSFQCRLWWLESLHIFPFYCIFIR